MTYALLSRLPCATVLAVAALVGSAVMLPSQRGVRALTTVGASDVQISPNGNWVAFKTSSNGTSALGIISTVPNSKPSNLVVDKSLTNFIWAPDSAGLYYQIASTVNYIRSIGGTAKQITKISGVNPRIYAPDSKDSFLIGTRSDSAGGNAIFTVPTDSSAFAKDILSSAANFFAHVTLDPTDKKIAYTSQLTQFPHAPIGIRAVDIDGKNDASMSGGTMPRAGVNVSLPRSLAWSDSGTTVLFVAVDTTKTTWEIMRVTTAGKPPVPMTLPKQHFQRLSVSRDMSLAVTMGLTFHGNIVPIVMPAKGGARIPLEPETNWVFAGPPSIDSGGLKVAFGGYKAGTTGQRPEVQLIELDREIVVEPRPELKAQLTFKLPLLFGERGTLFLSTGLLPADPKKQLQVPGFTYGVAIDLNILFNLVSGVGKGPPLSFTATVPNDTALIGFTVYLQGVRVRSTNPDKGDFTRYAELQFFAN